MADQSQPNPWGYDQEREARWARERRNCLVLWLCDNVEAGKAVLEKWALTKGASYVAALREDMRAEWRRRRSMTDRCGDVDE